MIELECKKVVFYSQQDEEVFFSWAQSIPSSRPLRVVAPAFFCLLGQVQFLIGH